MKFNLIKWLWNICYRLSAPAPSLCVIMRVTSWQTPSYNDRSLQSSFSLPSRLSVQFEQEFPPAIVLYDTIVSAFSVHTRQGIAFGCPVRITICPQVLFSWSLTITSSCLVAHCFLWISSLLPCGRDQGLESGWVEAKRDLTTAYSHASTAAVV